MTDRKWTALRIPLDARGRPWDVSITTRFLSYAALGWGVSDGAFGVMGWAERRWWLTQP